MKKGIIFDMDGTLWDSAENVAASWNVAMKQVAYNREPITKQDMYNVMGKTMDVIADILFEAADENEREILLEECCKVENDYLREHGGELYPDIRITLENLRTDYHLYIVSNCQKGYIEAFLDYYQMWDLFEDIECFGNNGLQKGENITNVIKRNNLDAAVYVGDIQGDYDAAMNAGIDFIHATYGFGEIKQEVVKINTFSELMKVIGNVI